MKNDFSVHLPSVVSPDGKVHPSGVRHLRELLRSDDRFSRAEIEYELLHRPVESSPASILMWLETLTAAKKASQGFDLLVNQRIPEIAQAISLLPPSEPLLRQIAHDRTLPDSIQKSAQLRQKQS